MSAIPVGTTRGAVVIGVDRPKILHPLEAAATGALDVQAWLGADYHVTAHTDRDDKPVRFSDIFDTVAAYAKCMTMEQLVIYFAGHGYYSAQSEVWLLSGAPDNPAEAINLRESAEFSRSSGIRNIIFIADTCRSVPQGMAASQVRGGSIFPNVQSPVQGDVDIFFATLPGDPAVEVSMDEAVRDYKGLFTEKLKAIHGAARQDDIVTVTIGGKQKSVFPNRRLKTRLPEFFREEVARARLRIRQTPQLRIESSEPIHLAAATVAPTPPPDGRDAAVNPRPFAGASAASSIENAARALVKLKAIPDQPKGKAAAADITKFLLAGEAEVQRRAEKGGHFETSSGAVLTGSHFLEAVAIGPQAIDVEHAASDAPKLRFKNAADDYGPLVRPFSAAIRFADGSGTIIAALPGYVASLLVRDGGLINISYSPAEGTERWRESQSFQHEAESRRAMAATAARHGVLAVDRQDAKAFGDTIRIGKSVDPTLGLYAALAYASVGLRDDAKSVLRYMQQDLHANMFDAWLLAGADGNNVSQDRPLVPLCPMLSQSWDYLAPAGAVIPALLRDAARSPSLWTTFRPAAMDAIFEAARKGELK